MPLNVIAVSDRLTQKAGPTISLVWRTRNRL
jgi:hypothetical protein